jgi:hypothetical protein
MFRPYPFTIMAAVFLAGAMLVNAAESLLKADGFGCSRSPKLVYSQFFYFICLRRQLRNRERCLLVLLLLIL